MMDLERLDEAWPRLADGLFDFLADIDMPDETLADLDIAIRACRLLANGERVEVCETHGHFPVAGSANCLFKEWGDGVGTPERCRIVSKLLVDYPKEEARDDENLRFVADARRTEEEGT